MIIIIVWIYQCRGQVKLYSVHWLGYIRSAIVVGCWHAIRVDARCHQLLTKHLLFLQNMTLNHSLWKTLLLNLINNSLLYKTSILSTFLLTNYIVITSSSCTTPQILFNISIAISILLSQRLLFINKKYIVFSTCLDSVGWCFRLFYCNRMIITIIVIVIVVDTASNQVIVVSSNFLLQKNSWIRIRYIRLLKHIIVNIDNLACMPCILSILLIRFVCYNIFHLLKPILCRSISLLIK